MHLPSALILASFFLATPIVAPPNPTPQTPVSVQRTSTCQRQETVNPPTGTQCGVKGSLSSPKVLYELAQPLTTLDKLLQDCIDKCFDWNPSCTSFSINKSLKNCRLYSAALNQMGFKAGGSGNSVPDFYSRACYNQACTTVEKTELTDAVDDADFLICPPFQMTYYGVKYNCVRMGSNGILSFGSAVLPSNEWINTPLPNYEKLAGPTIAAFWTDMIVRNYTDRHVADQGMSFDYDILDAYPRITFTWKEEVFDTGNDYGWIHFEITYDEQYGKGIFFFDVRDIIGTLGEGATIGMQNQASGKFVQVAYNTQSVQLGTRIVLDTVQNTYTRTS